MNKVNQTINNVKKIKCQIDLTKCMIPTKCFNTEWLADDTFSSTKKSGINVIGNEAVKQSETTSIV